MGMYDSFYDEDSRCPKCKAKIKTDWQTTPREYVGVVAKAISSSTASSKPSLKQNERRRTEI